jgi:hypothetical protein
LTLRHSQARRRLLDELRRGPRTTGDLVAAHPEMLEGYRTGGESLLRSLKRYAEHHATVPA